mmetsp:Transcript_36882/g.104088  ORF Transcript_36882/g.104088 Transcript_36882/m.104088 type:complete len:386 (+) Transcript_36882:262-1419(+)|eukprot:CAMPEP_0117651284 /NCGR_PEP_ID=MMETSP0804-20121206/2008_1 /TAXON_ID=1074897 /ORGANISM="Tetraselmis astigmatica, Strain CCMP880" /LENGTH=385 /DNA_ID=CAMNT_0005457247 /DNA_START=238 /DNA_END=1395 /DNA_ORIENTATION=+
MKKKVTGAAGRAPKGQLEEPVDRRLPQSAVYALLVMTQVAFGSGAVYLKFSLQSSGESFHPVTFALYRELMASGPLLLISRLKSGVLAPPLKDIPRFLAIGLTLFLNQLLFICGLNLSGAVMATCIQPSIPVLTVALAVLLGTEEGSLRKLGGILMAVAGALCMVVGSSTGVAISKGDTVMYGFSGRVLMGNLFLAGNCLSAACFYVGVKAMTLRFHSASITAWSYSAASLLMALTAAAVVESGQWALPPHAWGPLLYWVAVSSVMGYYILTWATSRLPASHVAASQCLQPFVGTSLGWLLLGERLTPWDLGALAIVLGLGVVISDRPTRPECRRMRLKEAAKQQQGGEAELHMLPLPHDEERPVFARITSAGTSLLPRIGSFHG